MLPVKPLADARDEWERSLKVCSKGFSDLRSIWVVQGPVGHHVRLVLPERLQRDGAPYETSRLENVVVWIDNPAVELRRIVGVSLSKSDSEYLKVLQIYASYFAGAQAGDNPIYGSNTSLRFHYMLDPGTYISFVVWDGEYQDLIMWEQLTDAARVALNDSSNFGQAEVPFSDEHYQTHLDNAWPR